MITDDELAQAIVAHGVDVSFIDQMQTDPGSTLNEIIPVAHKLVTDWRVVGAMIEKCQKVYIEYINEKEQVVYARSEHNRTWEWISNESLPRAINEACAEALKESK